MNNDLSHLSISHHLYSGCGIPRSYKEKLFTPFSQAAQEYNRPHEGTGLGLYICYKIITAWSGTIQVEDNHPRGTYVVYLYLYISLIHIRKYHYYHIADETRASSASRNVTRKNYSIGGFPTCLGLGSGR